MPNVLPPGGAVHWPADEPTIGVVGVAPWATVDFYARLTQLVPAEKDWHHPRVLVDSNPKIPSRGRCLELGEASPVPAIRATIAELHRAGASLVVVPCNTAHYFHADFAAGAPCEVPDMIAVTARALADAHPQVRRVAVLGSRITCTARLYERRLAPLGIETVDVTSHLDAVRAVIEAVKQGGRPAAALAAIVAQVVATGAEAVILGCTELSLVAPGAMPVPVVDSADALARWCVQRLRSPVPSSQLLEPVLS